jgi:hypothetical protein
LVVRTNQKAREKRAEDDHYWDATDRDQGNARVPGNPLIKGTFWLDDVKLKAIEPGEDSP